MTTTRNTRRGFTLIELLLASAIMAVLAAAMYEAMRIGFKARDTAMAAVGPARSAEIAVDLVRRDLESALPPNGLFAGTFLGRENTDMPGTSAVEFYNVAAPPPSLAATGGASLGITGAPSALDRSDPMAYGGNGVQRVNLLLLPASTGDAGRVLVRRIVRNLLAPTEPVPEDQIICRGVIAFTVRYYDGLQWNEQWDSTQYGDVLPVAVEISLEIAGPRDPTAAITPAGEIPANRATYRASRTFFLPCRNEAALTQGVTP